MIDGYIRVAAATPEIKVADCAFNAEQILTLIKKADNENIALLCLSELCITGYTCGNLFLQDTLIESAQKALDYIVRESAGCNVIVMAGFPLLCGGKLFNTAAVFCGGRILGFVPKKYLPDYNGFNEGRYFTPAYSETIMVHFNGMDIPLGTNLIFQCENMPEFKAAAEICEDLWTPCPPSVSHAEAGAAIIANLAASGETVGKAAYRRLLVSGQSAKLLCGYVYADAGRGESSTDMVFGGHNLICEKGTILKESQPFEEGWAVSEIDLKNIFHERRRMNTFSSSDGYMNVQFSLKINSSVLSRFIDPHPFVPNDEQEKSVRCNEVLNIQVSGLVKRIAHINCEKLVIGVSGGLDSSLALLAACRALAEMNRPMSDVLAVTMPCFGTTERTKSNARRLCEALGVTCREIDITDSVRQHLRDIGHSEENHNVVYENAQARIRTLVLMDLANQSAGIVIGTGDLSELALGWATYNGDHMSMYGVNAGVPKTLLRYLIKYESDNCGNQALKVVLSDILETPVSPELLPPKEGVISQETESIVGPYELHDFFLYHVVRWGRRPADIFKLASIAFTDVYTGDEILKWLRVFYRRFFTQQFKRNCLPDGPKIGSVSFSPRGDWRMPSDAVYNSWLEELEGIEELNK